MNYRESSELKLVIGCSTNVTFETYVCMYLIHQCGLREKQLEL